MSLGNKSEVCAVCGKKVNILNRTKLTDGFCVAPARLGVAISYRLVPCLLLMFAHIFLRHYKMTPYIPL